MFKKLQLEEGFSLIELAIGLLLLSLLMVPVLMAYRIQAEARKVSFNEGQFNEIKESINSFVTHQGRYPLPANMLATPTNADYGAEVTGAIADCTVWPTPNGVCSTGGADPILIGAVPFDALGISQEFTYDLWHNKILYAVTEAQAMAYNPGEGKIITRGYNEVNQVRTETLLDSDVDMVLISHGETGAGAYAQGDPTIAQGAVLVTPCGADGSTADQENCDFDETFFLRKNDNTGVGSAALAPGGDFYDDLTDSQRSVTVASWLQNLTNSDVALTYATRIGVGTENPQGAVHVIGDVRVTNVLSDSVCNSGGANCFNPIIIAGDEPQMDCTVDFTLKDRPVVNLGNSQVFCASPVDTGGNPLGGGRAFVFPDDFGRISCVANGQLMTGIDSNGDPICAFP